MKNFTRGTLLTLIIVFSLGWAQQEVQDNAFVRVAHLSPNAEQVSITLASTEEGGQQLSPEELSSLSYRDTTNYLQIPEGEYDVAVETPQGTLQETLTFNSGVYYTVAAIGLVIPENLGQEDAQEEEGGFFSFLNNLFGGEEDRDALELRLVSYEDEFVTATTIQPTAPGVTPDAPAATPVQPGTATGGAAVGQAEPVETARVRLVHAAPGTAPVSLVGVVEGQEQEDTVFVSDLPFAEASSYNDLSAAGVGNYEVRLEGSEAVALDLSDVSLEPGDIYTLFVIGTPTEEAPLEVLPLRSQPSPQGAAPAGVGAATGGTQTGGTMTGGAMTGGAMTGGAGPQTGPQATVQLQDTQGNTVGTASFTPAQDGVQVQVQLTNFPEASQGEHGIHIHQVGQCEPPFESAGDHFNPTGVEHGFLNPGEPHAGDLPNIQLDGDGNASYTVTTKLVTLGQGQRSLNDEDGSALIIHSNPDDYRTNPSGDSGSRIACGVITQGQGEGQ